MESVEAPGNSCRPSSSFPFRPPTPTPSRSRRDPTATSGSPRLLSNKIGDDQPDDPRHHRVRHARPPAPTPTGSRRAPTATSGSPSRPPTRSATINPTTHAITEFPIPTNAGRPHGITAGPDGNLWFTEWAANKIGTINPTTHAITEFAIPDRQFPGRDHGGPRRQPLVHRGSTATRSG